MVSTTLSSAVRCILCSVTSLNTVYFGKFPLLSSSNSADHSDPTKIQKITLTLIALQNGSMSPFKTLHNGQHA